VLNPGDTFGPYLVLEVLGRGSFATVYKVGAPFLPRPMALKVSHDPVGADPTAQRALREISILSSLTNPHVVRLHDSGRAADGRVYLLMDWLEGRSLAAAHDPDDAMPAARAVGIVHQACLGLAEAHAHGIVHRDLKPENLWITPDGTVVVLDFGLARSWNFSTPAGAPATVGHLLVGTPHYTQPEQVSGEPLTPASDVYSLSTLLYELLTGRSPFFADQSVRGARAQLSDDAIGWLRAHCLLPVVPLRSSPIGAQLPVALTELVERGLAKAPEQRPADAGVLANALGEILHHDLGVAFAAVLRITHPYGGHEDRLLLPGSHRIGSDAGCELRLVAGGMPGVAAVIEWTGAPRAPLLRPIGAGLLHQGRPVLRPVRLAPLDRIELFGHRIDVSSLPGMGGGSEGA
jgi:serine/threonine-protein kinase